MQYNNVNFVPIFLIKIDYLWNMNGLDLFIILNRFSPGYTFQQESMGLFVNLFNSDAEFGKPFRWEGSDQ